MSKISKDLYDTIFKLLNEQEAAVDNPPAKKSSADPSGPLRQRRPFELTPQEKRIKEVERQAAIDREVDEQLSIIDPAMKLSDQPSEVADYEGEARFKVDTGKPVEYKSVGMKPKLKESISTLIRSKFNLIK